MNITGKITHIFSIIPKKRVPATVFSNFFHISTQDIAIIYEGVMCKIRPPVVFSITPLENLKRVKNAIRNIRIMTKYILSPQCCCVDGPSGSTITEKITIPTNYLTNVRKEICCNNSNNPNPNIRRQRTIFIIDISIFTLN